MKKYKAVIFDLDGTLIDSREDLGMAVNRVLEAEGYPAWPLEQYGLFMGRGIRNLVVSALAPYTSEEDVVERVRGLVMEDYGRNYLVATRYYPGMDKVLDFLKANRVKTAVLSNKPHEITLRIMAELFAPWPFDAVCGAMAGVPMKPDPEALRGICRKLVVEPGEALYVGDSEVDVETAANAGMACAACSWGYRGREVLTKVERASARSKTGKRSEPKKENEPKGEFKIIDRPEDIIILCK